jgi:hypothetical protein
MRLEDLVNITPNQLANSLKKVEESDIALSVTREPLPDYLLTDPEVVGYPDLEMQENLYDYAVSNVLPLVLDLDNPIEVVDIGAGRGDLRAFLERRYQWAPVNFEKGLYYFGYELNGIHRNIARQKYGLELYKSDFVESRISFDGWGFCIGSLNDDYGLFPANSISDKFQYFKKLVDVCLNRLSQGVVFILLNETSEDQPNLIPFPIPEMMEFLDTEYPDLAFNLDYSKFQGIYKLTIYNQMLKS